MGSVLLSGELRPPDLGLSLHPRAGNAEAPVAGMSCSHSLKVFQGNTEAF